MPYVKLDENILGSTVWFEDHATFRVWIYLLLSADPSGIVVHTVPKIAHDCKTRPDVVRAAFERWQKPDPDSRTPEHEGARIRVERDPEWQIEILNFEKYRKKDHTAAERKRRQRSRRDTVTSRRDTVTSRVVTRDVTEAEAEAEADTNGHERIPPAAAVPATRTPARAREQGRLEGVGLPGVPDPPRVKLAHQVAEAYLRTFNTTFGRRVASLSVQREVLKRIEARLRDGIEPELLVALPILAKSEGTADFLGRDPLILLRDGKHGRTKDGQTYGATDHAVAYAGRLDRIVVPPRLSAAAQAAGVSGWLLAQGVEIRPADDSQAGPSNAQDAKCGAGRDGRGGSGPEAA